MSNVLLSQETRGAVVVALNRPERRNASDDALVRELERRFTALARNRSACAADAITEARALAEERDGLAVFPKKRKPSSRT